jgi:hypothetical protein
VVVGGPSVVGGGVPVKGGVVEVVVEVSIGGAPVVEVVVVATSLIY